MTRAVRRSWILAAALVILGISHAAAQSSGSQGQRAAPVSMNGWQYENSPAGMFTFNCNPPVCPSKSVVVYRLLSSDVQMTFEQYRRSAEPITQEMQKANTHGVRFELVGVDDGSKKVGALELRLFKTRRVVTAPDGAKRSMINGYVFGSRYTVSITSSAGSEKESEANFMQFSAPLWLLAENKLETRP